MIEGKFIGYARTSREDQCLDLQINALKIAEIDDKNIFQEQVSALSEKRPQFDLALKRCRKGDTLVVWKLDRLGRSVKQLIDTVNDLKARGVDFKSLTEGFDTSTPMGTMIFHIMAAMAQMERDTTIERTKAGLAAAKERKTYTTRKLSFNEKQWENARKYWLADETYSVADIHEFTKISKAVLQREKTYLKAGATFNQRFPYEANRSNAK